MFPEYRELISRLKHKDHHFTQLFERHNALDQQVINMENRTTPGTPEQIEGLKKQKLHLKDQLYAYLRQVAAGEGH